MLQQTRVATVVSYYTRFLQRFPDLPALAAAPREQVLQSWAGLGYYARARQAHACARLLVRTHAGRFPVRARELEQLPGIGPSTAAAIAAFCFGERAAILDANVKRVLTRRYAVEGDIGQPGTIDRLWRHARNLLPAAPDVGRYTQAIMDLGALVCTRTRPDCARCPVCADCLAHRLGRENELPARIARAERPVRVAHLLIVLHRRRVLLEQRAPSGIWGGMLSLPQFSSRSELLREARRLGAESAPVAMAQRRHGFTHFTLAWTPSFVQLAGTRAGAQAPERRWLALRHIEDAALPAPILALLRSLRDAHY